MLQGGRKGAHFFSSLCQHELSMKKNQDEGCCHNQDHHVPPSYLSSPTPSMPIATLQILVRHARCDATPHVRIDDDSIVHVVLKSNPYRK
jgi:hypothetical protein